MELNGFLIFTPYNPESLGLQTGNEGNFKSKDKEKPHPLGQGYTGFTFNFSIPQSAIPACPVGRRNQQ
jgi:hypothetical protein